MHAGPVHVRSGCGVLRREVPFHRGVSGLAAVFRPGPVARRPSGRGRPSHLPGSHARGVFSGSLRGEPRLRPEPGVLRRADDEDGVHQGVPRSLRLRPRGAVRVSEGDSSKSLRMRGPGDDLRPSGRRLLGKRVRFDHRVGQGRRNAVLDELGDRPLLRRRIRPPRGPRRAGPVPGGQEGQHVAPDIRQAVLRADLRALHEEQQPHVLDPVGGRSGPGIRRRGVFQHRLLAAGQGGRLRPGGRVRHEPAGRPGADPRGGS